MPIQLLDPRQIFLEAVENHAPGKWPEFLDSACGDDTAVRERVEALLAAHGQPNSLLDGSGLLATIDSPPAEWTGTQIGPYKLLEQIGEGGFGIVFMAEQTEPVRRRVALKVIKPGMDTRQVIARFEAERQALALMDHPNIAKVLDAGTVGSSGSHQTSGEALGTTGTLASSATGRPYFVMELVRGTPITEFCDRNKVSVRQRLALFVSVVHAIQHAHQKGVIHRDIKPTNVLVTLHDGVPVPKVIDFGIAKAAGQQLTEKTLFTNFAQMIGTPLYMSPEQAEMSGLDVDTRSDIYSLGVLLYELLTGTTPFDKERLKKAGYDEIRRIIREDEPARPSVRISTHAEAAETISANRSSDPRRLFRLIRGELDWIVMKCLEKDRNRRYETASALVADVQRYLHDEPVQACPPSAWYRFRKLARRNAAALVAASAVAAAVLVALISLGGTVRVLTASNERIKAEQKQTHAALGEAKAANESLAKSLAREELAAYAQRTALAGRELAAGNVGHAEELLGECPEELRGWEWHFLKRQRYEKPAPMQHEATVIKVAFSPNGQQVASVDMDGAFAIRDPRTGRVLYTLERQQALHRARLVRGLAYSPDSRYLALARHDGTVRLWNATDGQPMQSLEGHKGPVWQVAFSPDSRSLVSGSGDGTVRLWDVASAKELRKFDGHPAPVKGVAFRPDGRSIVAACDDGTVKVWDREAGRELFSFRGELANGFVARFSPDTRRLGWACIDGVVKVWDTTTGKLEIDKQSNTHQCRAIEFHPDGKRIALAGFDGTLRLLDAVSGREMFTIFAHAAPVADAAFSRDGNQLVSGSYDHTVRIWDATRLPNGGPLTAHCVTLDTGHKETVSGVAFSPDGRWLASSSWDGTAKVWECQEGQTPVQRYTLRGHSGRVIGVVASSDGRTLATGSWDKTVKLWDLHAPVGESLTELRTILTAHRVASIAFSADGRFLAVGQAPGGIAMYDPTTGKEAAPSKWTPTPVPALAFNPVSGLLASASASDPAIRFWDMVSEKEVDEIRHYSNPNSSVAFSPDGKLIACQGRDKSAGEPALTVWDVRTKEVRHIFKGHALYVWKVAFSPEFTSDGEPRYLASGSWDSTIKIWDLTTGQEAATLRGHAGIIHGLAFNHDGSRLASGSGHAGHGEVKIWDASLWQDKAEVASSD